MGIMKFMKNEKISLRKKIIIKGWKIQITVRTRADFRKGSKGREEDLTLKGLLFFEATGTEKFEERGRR